MPGGWGQQHGIRFDLFTYHQAKLDGRIVKIIRGRPDAGLETRAGDDEVTTAFGPAAIINATGAWVDHTLRRLDVPSKRLMGGTKGSHFVTHNARVKELLQGYGIYAEAPDGRPVFILPFGNATLVGTTDIPFDDSPETAVTTDVELDYLIGAVNQILPNIELTRDDINLYYCGVRPLPYQGGNLPASITRRHWLEENSESDVPLFSVIGGKLTTCRSLAEKTAETVLPRLGRRPETNSRERVVPGGETYPDDSLDRESEVHRLAVSLKLTQDQIKTVWSLVGTRFESIHHDSSDNQTGLATAGLPLGFVRWVIRNEWVTRLSDLVERRLMLIYQHELSEDCLRQLAALMVDERLIGWDAVDAEVQECTDRLKSRYGKAVLVHSSDEIE